MLNVNKMRPLVGIIISETDKTFFKSAMCHVREIMFKADVDIAIFSPPLLVGMEDNFINADKEILGIMNLELFDGIMIYTDTLDAYADKEEIVKNIKDNFDGPIICFEEALFDLPCERFSDKGGTYKLVEHLIKDHGVKTIDYVSGEEHKDRYLDKLLDNFTTAMHELGYDIPKNRIHYGDNWVAKGNDMVEEIMSNPEGMPDAVICSSDTSACAVILAFEDRGVHVPGDIIVCGYGKDEPYENKLCNVSSVIRNPKAMAINASCRLLEAMGIKCDDSITEEDFCILCPSNTCGCENNSMYDHIKATIVDNLYENSNSYFSQYNFMAEEMMNVPNYEEFWWKVDWYATYINNPNKIFICLNEGVMLQQHFVDPFTDQMYIPYLFDAYRSENGSVDLTRNFDRRMMLPDIFDENRTKPAGYIFSTLHFMEDIYGYVAISFDDDHDIYSDCYSPWLRTIANTLQMHRKRFIYEDTVKDAQIRDSLTGLLNMRGYNRIMTERCGNFDMSDKMLRIISIDVDNLKHINDAFGHAEGDKLLTNLAIQMMSCARDDDLCVRVSGDEFFIASIIDADNMCDNITNELLAKLDAFNDVKGRQYAINIHSATAYAPITSQDILEKLLYEASYIRSSAKDNSEKNLLKTGMIEEEFDHDERENVIKLLNGNMFTYQFQPIVNAKTGEIYSYEGLMRSGSKVKISPIAILNHAEALGRLYDIEKSTMFNLFDVIEKNPNIFEDRKLFINSIPAYNLSETDFEILHNRYGSVMDKAVIEFTEQTEANSVQLDSFMKRSEESGFKLAIDDYGTGYSNINHLLDYNPDYVKIDRSLISNINEDSRKQHFVKNLIEYAHDNDFMALAEGVETYDELQMAISLGADLIQGYYTSRPQDTLITSIDEKIKEEIACLSLQANSYRKKKVYIATKETELNIVPIALDNYTDLVVSQSNLSIVGNMSFDSDVTIRIKDGVNTHLTLTDLTLSNVAGLPCIVVGTGCRLTLEIKGDVTLMGAIYVPEKSSISIVGDGTLTIKSTTNQTYGIGCDINHSYGNIDININMLHICIDSYQNVAIGGGYNNSRSAIHLHKTAVKIEQTGKITLGIGCLYSRAIIRADKTNINIMVRVATGIGIGGYTESIEAYINESTFEMDASGGKIVSIGSFSTKGSSITIDKAKVNLVLNAKNVMAIGSDMGAMDVIFSNSTITTRCTGDKVVTVGSFNKKSMLSIFTSSCDFFIQSAHGMIYGTAEPPLVMDSYIKEELI